jgi:integrase
MGTIYRRKGKKVLWVKYYRSGKPFYESSHSRKMEVARRLLRKREGEISKGELPGICFDKIRFDELADDFITDYRINKRKSLDKADRCVKYLKKAFGGLKVTQINTASIKTYIDERMEKGFSNASINRELSALKRIFHLGARCTPPKVGQIPYVPMLKESNVRKGFFEHEQFLAVKSALPEEIRPVVTFAYHSGWRKSEILNLTWDKVDLKQGVARLDPGETKNDEARTLYMDEELWREMRVLHSTRRLGCPYVFHRNGAPIRDFRDSWDAACTRAKVDGRFLHDFRRTAVRNMVRAGVPERVAMKITGHKTRSVFDRYNIVSDEDLKDAARKQQAYLDQQNTFLSETREKGHIIPLRQAKNE